MLRETLSRTGLAIMDLALPRCCAVCGQRLRLFEKHLCTGCLADIPYTYYWRLRHNPMADRFNERIQTNLTDGIREHYCNAAALFFFNSEAPYRHIPYRIKYRGDIELGRFFGRMLGKRLLTFPEMAGADVITPVPLHWSRLWKRGYNQAEAIASGMSMEMGIDLRKDLIYRTRRTETQTRLSVQEKAANVTGAFGTRIPPGHDMRHIIIVDDVFTTGATLAACHKAIRSSAPLARISIATLAFVIN